MSAARRSDMVETRGRVLITGLNGFTGTHLRNVLASSGFEVHGTVTANESANEQHHVADLGDVGALREAVRRVRPTHVVHLAAISFVSHDDVQEIYRTNIIGTRNLLSALADSDVVRETLQTVLIASSVRRP